MAVKISRLFKDNNFQKLSKISKILYIYLATNPDINSVGVLSPNPSILCLTLQISKDELRKASIDLIKGGYLFVKEFNAQLFFIVPEHFKSIPKSESSIERIQRDLATLPNKLVLFLGKLGINIKAKVSILVKPSPEEVSDFALSLGYLVNGKTFIEYYESQSLRYNKKDIWVDARGNQVRDWKSKLRRVWLKEENKLKDIKDAPKGFETFSIKVDGNIIIPDGWRDGKPYNKSLSLDIALKKEFSKLN